MEFEVGSQIVYEDEARDSGYVRGTIVGISQDKLFGSTTYLAQLISGEYIQIKEDNLYRCSLN